MIDVDRDDEGMRVIADLHGGDPNDVVARAEFQEIKDRVIFEVRTPACIVLQNIETLSSVSLGKAGPTPTCGGVTNAVFY